jgi:hypothetical protein
MLTATRLIPAPIAKGDYDHDGNPSELDADSDNGGCKDGEEDLNGNGELAGNETDNFDETDDICGLLQGNLSYRSEFWPDSIDPEVRTGRGVIQVRVKPETGSPSHFVDDGSTFTYRSFGRLEIDFGQVASSGPRETASGGGPFVPPEGKIGMGVGDDGTVAVEAEMSVPSRTVGAGAATPAGRKYAGWALLSRLRRKEGPRARRPGVPVTYRFDCLNSGTTPDGSTYSTKASGYLRLQ